VLDEVPTWFVPTGVLELEMLHKLDHGIKCLCSYTRVPCYMPQDTILAGATRVVYDEAQDPRDLYVCSYPLRTHVALPVTSRRAGSSRCRSAIGTSVGANESSLDIGRPCYPEPNMAPATGTVHTASTRRVSCEEPQDELSNKSSSVISHPKFSDRALAVTNEAVNYWSEQRPGRPSRRALPTEV